MVRAIALLVSAITMTRPGIPKEEATRYAKVLNEISSKNDIDPLLAVAMIHYESRWIPSAASDDGEDFGLGQLRARYIGACRNDEDPIHAPSDACKAVKVNLLVGETNLRAMGGIIGANKKMCAEKRGKNKAEYWIAGYQGLSNPERNKYCVPGPTTTRVMEYHKELLAALVPTSKEAKAAAIAKAKPAVSTKTPAATARASHDKPAATKAATPAKAAAKPAKAPVKTASTGKNAAKPAKTPTAQAPQKPGARHR